MIGTKKQKTDNKGFTLAELLVVIAIIGILAGVSFVAVGKYIRNLQQLEMDNTAKEIFIAAQNHLSASDASGEFKRNYEDAGAGVAADFGDSIDHRPGYVEDDDTLTGDEEYRYVIYEGYHADHSDTPGTKKAVLEKYMLPVFSIDSEIGDKGNYIIVYEAKSASVLAVFYSGRAHTFFGAEKVHRFEGAEAEESGNTYLAQAVAERNKRIHYRESEEDTIIGCYTSNGRDYIQEKTFKPLTLNLKNGAKLTAEITNPNYVVGDSSQILTLVVKGCTSENIQTIKLKGKGDTSVSGSTFETSYDNKNGPVAATENRTYSSSAVHYSSDAVNHEEVITFTLDDITVEKGHFCNNFPYLIPGEDVEVYVELSDTESFASTIRSETETENSLFENISLKGSRYSVAEIGNIRHLENLDPDISDLSFIKTHSSVHADLKNKAEEIEIKQAEQISDISYSGDGSFISELSGNTTQHVSTYHVYKYGGKSADKKEGYYGIANANLKSYDGHKYSIINIYSKTGSGEHTGIFSNVLFTSPSDDFTVKNLTVREGRFHGTNDSGAIIGHSEHNVVIENCTVTGGETDVDSVSGNAGGLLGACAGKLTVDNSVVSGWTLNIGANASGMASGGMIGKCTGDLIFKYNDLEGGAVNVTSTSGASGGLIGDAAAVTFKSSFLKANNLAVTGNTNAGGLIGKISGTSTLSGVCYLSGNTTDTPAINITASSGNAGGVIGNAASTSNLTITGFHIDGLKFAGFNISGADSTGGTAGGIIGSSEGTLTIKGSDIIGKNLNISADNAGGIVGKSTGTLSIDSAFTIGENLKISANTAGGIAGSTSGNLDISKTYASAYVFGISNAGGFIGSINGGTGNKIEACYASGHTKNGSYSTGTVKTAAADNYNVQSGGNSGGFIGYASSVTVSNSYTTCSAYSSAAAGYAGGFAGQTVNMSVSNCYSAGLVGIATGGKIGGFAGFGTVSGSATGNSYYLKGNGFNDTLSAGSSGSVISYVLNTAGSEIQAASMVDDTNPWDTVLASKKYKYKTTYMLSGNTACMSSHYGDWTEVEEDKLTLSLVNAEKLTAILSVPTSALTGIGNYASFLVEGKKSEKAAYMQFELSQHDITPIDKTTAIYNITLANGGNPPNADQEYLSFPEYTFPSNKNLVVKTEGSYTEFHIDLDDITTVNKNFASIFTAFTPGEDIRVTAEWGALSWDTMMTHANQKSQRVPITGITNSLFASGSGNSNYTDKNYYSDRFPTVDIIDKDASASAYSGMALVTNFRHLQNLDTEVSNVSDSYTKAKICRDLYWDTTSVSDLNTLTSGDIKAFVPAIRTANGLSDSTPVKIYSYNAEEPLTIESKSAFYGIVNSNLEEFDGDYHSVNNILIYNDNNTEADGSAGFFRTVTTSSSTTLTKTIKNFTIVEPAVVSELGAVGGLIGYANNDGTIVIQNVYVYGTKAIVRTMSQDGDDNKSKANAGGLIGYAYNGGFTIKNAGASVYVYAENARCAGGFIGSLQPRADTTVENCFVGGHVDGTDYAEGYALSSGGVDSNITVEKDGGYNVVSWIATGGFVGYIGTENIHGVLKFNECFTTASVYSPKEGNNVYTTDGGAVGGFIGRAQRKNQQYENCYVEGKVWSGTDMACLFIGHFHKYNELSDSEAPKFTNCLVLNGLNFNTDLHMMYQHTSPADIVSDISPVEADDTKIRASTPEYIKVEVFNRTKSEFPYKDTAMYKIDGHNWNVFFGDWVEPDSLSPVKIINGNRLIARINLRSETTYATEYIDGRTFFVTYIRLKGQVSGAEPVFKVYFGNGEVHVNKLNPYETQNIDYKASVDSLTAPTYLDFCIDNVSVFKGNYLETMKTSDMIPYNEHAPKPGEDFTIYASNTLEGANSDSAPNATANSLFQDIGEIKDGTGTGTGNYIASIANSRHLMNLNSAVSALDSSIKVTQAVQTDNIYWADDGTYVTQVGYTAYTPPYETELEGLGIVLNGSAVWTSPGKMKSIISDSLGLYDGGNHAIYKAAIEPNDPHSPIGIFASNPCALTIQNLKLVSPSIIDTSNKSSAGILVGVVENPLTVNNLSVSGNLDVTCGTQSGALIGSSATGVSLDLNHVTIDGNVTVSAPGAVGGVAGGLIGETGGVTTINDVNVSGSITVNQAQIAGGLIAKSNNGITMTNMAVAGPINVTSSLRSGGLVGEITGSGDFSGINVTGDISVSGSQRAGGFVGDISGNLTMNNITYNCNHLSVISNALGQDQIAGGLVGETHNHVIMNHILENGNIIVSGASIAGGIIGKHSGSPMEMNDVGITSSMGEIMNSSGQAGNLKIGGFIGYLLNSDLDIKNCYSSVYVDGYGSGVGGFIGDMDNCTGTLKSSYASGHTYMAGYIDVDDTLITQAGRYNVNMKAGEAVGGFIGAASGNVTIQNCFAANSVNSNANILNQWNISFYVGGFAGKVEGDVIVDNCYSVSYISDSYLSRSAANLYNAGVFAGNVNGGTITDSYCIRRQRNQETPCYGTLSEVAKIDSGQVDVTLLSVAPYNDILAATNSVTVHHDPFRSNDLDRYPYKNWTFAYEPNPESIPVFYGDW